LGALFAIYQENVRLGLKGSPGTNTVAYLLIEKEIKMFIKM